MPKPRKQSKDLQNDPEGDPQASQNQVEYGGAGWCSALQSGLTDVRVRQAHPLEDWQGNPC